MVNLLVVTCILVVNLGQFFALQTTNQTQIDIITHSNSNSTQNIQNIEVVKNVSSKSILPNEIQIRLGIDYEFSVNERDTLKLKCPIDLKEKISGNIDHDESSLDDLIPSEGDDDNDDDETDDYSDSDSFYDTGSQQSIDENDAGGGGGDSSHRRKRQHNKLVVVQWFKDSTKITKYKFSARYELDGVYMRISDVSASDAGKYRCKFINGFGTLSSAVTLRVNKVNDGGEGENVMDLDGSTTILMSSTTTIKTTTTTTLRPSQNKKMLKLSAPVFVGLNKVATGGVQRFRKEKGAHVRFNCRAFGVPKPEILWLKNGEVLSEEDYGITRSKWLLDLKDLRMDDNANFTCQVFNKFGYINSTFELIVYEESQIFEGLDPLNATITVGMDAVFNCKVKSSNQPNIKWMKQISKSEYQNYVIQNSHVNPSNAQQKLIDASSQNNAHENNQPDDLNSFFALSTLPSLRVIEKKQNPKSSSNEELYLSDLIGGDATSDSSSSSDFKFDLYVPNEFNSNEEDALSSYLKNKRLPPSATDYRNKQFSESVDNNDDADSVHYITLSSSQIEERMTYDEEKQVYVSQLMLKQAQVKDTGVYVCFGASSQGYSYRKSHLKVIPAIRLPDDDQQQQQYPLFNYRDFIPHPKLIIESQQHPTTSPTAAFNFQSVGFFMITLPILFITLFAIISICYLKKLDSSSSSAKCFLKLLCLGTRRHRTNNNNNENTRKSSAQPKQYLCCPTNIGHMLMTAESSSTYEPEIEFSKHQKRHNFFEKTKNMTDTSLPCPNGTTNSSSLVSSSLSDSSSSSTTATTVAYYATIPLLVNEMNLQSPPPPLPQSQPPTFSPKFNQTSTLDPRWRQNEAGTNLARSDSTPSMAYYKIVDSDLIESCVGDGGNKGVVDNDDNLTCVSAATSRFYYQLTPPPPHQHALPCTNNSDSRRNSNFRHQQK